MGFIWVIRVAFILVIFGVGFSAVADKNRPLGESTWILMAASLVIGVAVILVDYTAPRKKLSIFAGGFFGLMAGLVLAYAISFVTGPILEQIVTNNPTLFIEASQRQAFATFINLIIGCVTCYLSVSFIFQTKDDFRFIIPYVEFAKQSKGSRPILLDTSVLIDGRIADLAASGVFDAQLIVPRFVINELQQVADSSDRLKRNRGRRGLDIVARLQKTPKLDIIVQEASHLDIKDGGVDQLLMALAKELNARVMTTDFNLNKVAQLTGVDVLNLNDISNSLKAEALPGETMRVKIVRPGEESNQGVGFLDDGTMVVVEHGRSSVGQDVEFVVTNTRQTSAGKMIFGRLYEQGGRDDPPTSARSSSATGSVPPSGGLPPPSGLPPASGLPPRPSRRH